jgi:hypothetical protein
MSEEFDSPFKEKNSCLDKRLYEPSATFKNSTSAESRQFKNQKSKFKTQNSYSPGYSLPSPTGRGKPQSGAGVGLSIILL